LIVLFPAACLRSFFVGVNLPFGVAHWARMLFVFCLSGGRESMALNELARLFFLLGAGLFCGTFCLVFFFFREVAYFLFFNA
jgi:hypothetical protein